MIEHRVLSRLSRWLQDAIESAASDNSCRRRRLRSSSISPVAAQVELLESRQLLSVIAPTNTVVGSSADPGYVGQQVTFTAAVAPALSSAIVPTGTVAFRIDGAAQHAVTLVDGLATLTLSTLSAGTHAVTAAYSGDANFAASTSPAFSQVVTASFTAPWHQTGAIDVTKHGVIGDGVTDDTTALQNLINSIPSGTSNPAGGVLFYFPAGTYVVSNTIDFSRLGSFGILGDVTAAGRTASTIETTTPNIAVVNVNQANSSRVFQIKNMQFLASVNGGTGFFTYNASNSSFENCSFGGYIGLNVRDGFVVAVRSSTFIGATGSNIGLLSSGSTADLVADSDFSGWTEGLRVTGAGFSIVRSTFEHNGIGARLGTDPQGNGWGLSRSSLQDLSFTGNNTDLWTQSLAFDVFSNISIQGTGNAPSGQSQYGLYIQSMQNTTFSGIHIGGNFTNAAVFLSNGQQSTFYASTISNTFSNGAIWRTQAGLAGVPANQMTLLGTGAPLTSVSVISSALLQPVNVDDVTASQVVPGPQNLVLDVTKYAVVGDSNTDDTAALQALINGAAPGTTFYFPQGVYKVSATIDFSKLSSFSFIGDVASQGGSYNGSTILGYFAAPLLKADYGSGAGTFHISNINLQSSWNSGSVALYARNAVLSSLQNVQIHGNTGIDLENPFKVSLRSVSISGPSLPSSNVGLNIHGGYGCTVESGNFTTLNNGILAGGTTNLAVYATRFETNNIAMNLGVDASGSPSTLLGASIQGISQEANNYHIICVSVLNSLFAGIDGDGTTSAAGAAVIGMLVEDTHGSTFASIGMGGAYSSTAQRVLSTASNLYFTDCLAGNGSSNGIVGPFTPTVNSLVTNDALPTITGTWDSAGATLLQVTFNGTTYTLGTNSQLTSDGSGHWTLATSATIADGFYNVLVHTTDAAGNVTDHTATNALKVDTVPPATPTVNALVTYNNTPDLTGTWDQGTPGGATVLQVTVNGSTFTLGTSSQLISNGSGHWTLATTTPIPDGTYNVLVHTANAAGNSADSTTSNQLVIELRMGAPSLTAAPASTAAATTTALLQKTTQGFALSSSARQVPYTSNVVTGSLLTAFIAFEPGSGKATVNVSDNINGAWTQAGGYVRNGLNTGAWFYFINSAGGSNLTVTVTPSAAVYMSIGLHEYRVNSPAGVTLDATASNTGSGETVSTGACAVSAPGDLVLAGFGQGTGALTSVTMGGPLTLETNQPIGTIYEGSATADDTNAGSSEAATFTMNAAVRFAAMAISFKIPAAASSAVVNLAWNAVPQALGYRVYQLNGTQPTLLANLGANATTYQVTGLAPVSTESFYVEAYNGSVVADSAQASVRLPLAG